MVYKVPNPQKLRVGNSYKIQLEEERRKQKELFKTEKEIKKTENQIGKILYEPNKEQTDKELFTIAIIKEKEKDLEFLEAYTKYKTEGVWKQYKDKNVQYEIEFKDSKDEKYGNKLVELFKKLNELKIKEELLYVRTAPVEESSL